MVQLLIGALPNIRNQSCIKTLCRNKNLDVEIGLEILKLLIERFSESVRRAGGFGLPIHDAAMKQTPRVLPPTH